MSAEFKAQLKEKILGLAKQLSSGCGRPVCTNSHCASNPACPVFNDKEALAQALKLVTQNQSFTLCSPCPPYMTYAMLEDRLQTLNDVQSFRSFLGLIYFNIESLNQSFLKAPSSFSPNAIRSLDGVATETQSGINYEDLEKGLALITSHNDLLNGFQNVNEGSLTNIKQELRYNRQFFTRPENLRVFLILLFNPQLSTPDAYKNIFYPLCSCFAALPNESRAIITNWISTLHHSHITNFLKTVQSFLSLRGLEESERHGYELCNDDHIRSGVQFLAMIHEANKKLNEVIPYAEFYNDVINEILLEQDNPELSMNFMHWREKEQTFTLCDYLFLLNPEVKSRLLRYDSILEQRLQQQQALRGNLLFFSREILYLVLRVDRSRLIQSTLDQIKLQMEHNNLKKELKVKFMNEEGIDEGGVQKEFFQLVVKEVFDEKYGMFVLNEVTRQFWFNSSFVYESDEDLEEYLLIGILLGLAIYNSVNLDVHFPFVVYKKLMGVPPTFDDLQQVQPEVYQMLKSLLDYIGDDMEETFGLSFEVMQERYGNRVTHNLIENGSEIPVTQENKHEFVRLYTKWYLEDSIKGQFDTFLAGFKQVCNGIFFDLFRVEEVELLICGNPVLDFEELQASTTYDNGYSDTHPVIVNFWKVIHSLSLEDQKKFLFFATGSDRSPIGGLKNLRFTITRHGQDSDRLPQAHTCFNVLLLPEYASLEKLRDRLTLAISNATGFGML